MAERTAERMEMRDNNQEADMRVYKIDGSYEVNGEIFNDYEETSLRLLLESAGFTVQDIFIIEDVRKDRAREKRVNVIAKEEIQCWD